MKLRTKVAWKGDGRGGAEGEKVFRGVSQVQSQVGIV